MGPREVAELGLVQNFREVFPRLDVLEVDVEPVGAGLGQAVRENGAILRSSAIFKLALKPLRHN